MLGLCYPQRDPLQPKGEQKPTKHRFPRYSDEVFDGSFQKWMCFIDYGDDQFDEFISNWHIVARSYDGVGSGEPLLGRLWQHVLTTGSDTRELYKEAVATMETQARAVFEEEEIQCSNDEFVEGMTDQGCFILHVALCYLGGPKPLGYHPDDPLFGEKGWNNKVIRFLVNRYMFFIEAQIPLVALKVLMKQSFFQNVLKSGKWKRPNDLAGIVLYDFLVEPMLLENPPVLKKQAGNSMRRLLGYSHKRNRWYEEQPTTLLHALWLLLTRPGSHGGRNHIEEDLYTSFSTVSSAKELQAAGIIFKSYEGFCTRKIKFKKMMLEAHLCLPCIYMEPNTFALFWNLMDFERDLDINRREISAYICFMNELIRDHDDVRLLVKAGVIGSDPTYEDKLPGILSEMANLTDRSEVGNRHNFAAVRRQIGRYVKPSMRTKIVNLVVIGVLLTLVQTIYSVLSYHHPLH